MRPREAPQRSPSAGSATLLCSEAAGSTGAVGGLVSVSACPASSKKLTRTLMVLPTSFDPMLYVVLVSPSMSVSELPSFDTHW